MGGSSGGGQEVLSPGNGHDGAETLDLELEDAATHAWELMLSPKDVRAAVMMGPNAHHREGPPEAREPITDRPKVVQRAST